MVYDLLGENELAETSFEQASAMYEATVGESHPALARCLWAWATHQRRLGRTSEAQANEGRATAIEAGSTETANTADSVVEA